MSAGTALADRRGRATRPPRVPREGVLAALRPGADGSWAQRVLRGDITGTWVWTGNSGRAVHQGMLTLQGAGVYAACLTPAGADLRHVRAAAHLSARLG